jgi:hypothetical protein
MKNILKTFPVIGFSLTVGFISTLALLSPQKAQAGCGWGDITCSPKNWTCPVGGCPPQATSYPPGVGKYGFYRVGNQDAVYRVYNTKVCKVKNREQMNAYGGFSQVSSVPKTSEILDGRNFVGECTNPDLFYRIGNQDVVYRLYSNETMVCNVKNREQMNGYGGFAQVRSAPSPSLILDGRNFIGECPNP